MVTSRFARGLLALGITSLLGCGAGVTMTELQALNPQAATLKVPCHPWQILETVKIFAVRPSGNDIVTDETQNELRDFAQHAGVFIEVNASAPPENVAIMASEYGLICSKDLAVRSTPLESIRQKEPCFIAANAPANRHLVGDTNAQPCAEPAPKSGPKRIHVCVKPAWIKGNVTEWALFKTKVKTGTTKDRAKFDADTQHAEVIFVLDQAAPPETAYYFTKDPKELSCDKKPTKTFEEIVDANSMPDLVDLNAANKAMEDQAKQKGATATGTSKKQGNGKTTSTSSPDGKGPPLDPFETVARELIFAGKLATTDTSAPATTADGSRHGMPGGKNVGGFSFPLLQAGVGLVHIAIGVGMKPQDFIKKVVEETGLSKPAIVRELNADALRIADELVKDYGEYVMAEAIRKQQLILPFGMAQKFTANLGGKFQAHKIFERQAIREFLPGKAGMTEEAIEKAVDEVAKKYPAIILSDAEHKVISTKLAAAWKHVGKNKMTKETLREIYKKAYEKTPHWLDAIESYLR